MTNRKVVIVGPNWLFRQGLKPVLRKLKLIVVGEGDDVATAFRTVRVVSPDIVLLVGQKVDDVAALISAIRKLQPDKPNRIEIVVSISDWTQEDVAAVVPQTNAILSSTMSAKMMTNALELIMAGHRIFACAAGNSVFTPPTPPRAAKTDKNRLKGETQIEDGAVGYSSSLQIVKSEDPNRIALAALALSVPVLRLPPVNDHTTGAPRLEGPSPSLSLRERQILRCLVRGQPNKLIARELNMAETTVKVHIKSLLRKLRAANRTQAAIWAMNNGQMGEMDDVAERTTLTQFDGLPDQVADQVAL